MKNPAFRSLQLTALALVLPGVCGCHSVGPKTILYDRLDYSAALGESWKSMMLLNIVKTRYLDLPIFLDVGQVVSGYTLQTSGNVGGSIQSSGGFNSLSLGGSALYSQQPTITYTPLTGEKFLEAFLDPVSPARVFSLIQAGYPADFLLQMSVDSLNGLRNQPISLASKYKADPDFFRAIRLLREIQDARAVGLRVDRPTNGQPASVVFFRSDKVDAEVLAKIVEARQLLGLVPGETSFRLIASPLRGGPGEIGVDTRSIWQILASLSLGVDLPPKHLARKLAPPLPRLPDAELLLRVHSGSSKPAAAYVTVAYEGEWFWIANDDWISKRTFSSILFLSILSGSGTPQNVPTLTIPTR